MRLIRGGDHTTAASVLDWAIGRGPAFLTDPRRGCAPGKVNPEWFFSENLTQAKKICHSCMFRNQCDAYATARHEQWGVWGGKLRSRRLSAQQAERYLGAGEET